MSVRLLTPIAALSAGAALWLILGGFGPGAMPASSSQDAKSSKAANAEGATGPATPERAVLRLRKTQFGKVIHEESSGLVAYLFTKEKSSKPRCYGACAKAWPPVKTKRGPRAGSGLKQKHLGTTKRRNGARMVTYKGRPLYFYEHDSPGLILCHDVFEFGGDWFVVKGNGKPA